MKNKIIIIITLLLLFSINTFSQDPDKQEKDEKTKQIRAKAIQLLEETRNEINSLRTAENRISFSSELANLMWYHDAEEGRRMFKNITDDFTEILGRYNADLNAFGGVKDESEFYMGRVSPTDKTRAIGKMTKAIAVRQQVALSIAAQDAELGNEFIERTSLIVTDKTFQQKIETQNEALGSVIITYMASQDIDKALSFARKQLKTNFRKSMLKLLAKVYEKDKEKAKSFASEVMDKVKSDLREPKGSFSNAYAVLEFGQEGIEKAKKQKSNKPIFDESALKSLADELANSLIRRSEEAEEDYNLDSYYSSIEQFSPSSAARLQRKYKSLADDKADEKIDKIKEAVIAGFGDSVDEGEDSSVSFEEQQSNRKNELFKKLSEKGFKELPDEERQKVIDEAQQIITAFKDPTEKIVGLGMLATMVKQLGDENLASELMNEASLLVTEQPKTYLDYLQVWALAGSYSKVEPNKTFPILENVIYQLNDTLEAFVKVGEFIDVGGDLVIDNEVQLGSFGGAMTRSLIGQLGGAEGVIKNLSTADFDKTKALAEKFGRTELRVLVKMMIVRSVLDDGKNRLSDRELRDISFLF